MATSNLTTMLRDFFDQQIDTDVTFNVAGEDLKAHKLILSYRSEVLKTMINNPISYVNGKILISDPDVTAADFSAFLRFFYTNEIEINRKNYETMLHLGDMYDVPLLMEKCVQFVKKDGNETNLLEYAEIGLLYSDQCSILSKCLKQIPKYFFNKAEQNSSTLLKFSLLQASPALILKIAQDSKRVGEFNEDKLFEAVFDWAKNECTNNPETTSLKEVLKDIIPFIKFENLKPITLETIVKENNLLEEKELLIFIRISKINESKKTNNTRKRRHLVPNAPRGPIIPWSFRDHRNHERMEERRERLEPKKIRFQQQMNEIFAIVNNR